MLHYCHNGDGNASVPKLTSTSNAVFRQRFRWSDTPSRTSSLSSIHSNTNSADDDLVFSANTFVTDVKVGREVELHRSNKTDDIAGFITEAIIHDSTVVQKMITQ